MAAVVLCRVYTCFPVGSMASLKKKGWNSWITAWWHCCSALIWTAPRNTKRQFNNKGDDGETGNPFRRVFYFAVLELKWAKWTGSELISELLVSGRLIVSVSGKLTEWQPTEPSPTDLLWPHSAPSAQRCDPALLEKRWRPLLEARDNRESHNWV